MPLPTLDTPKYELRLPVSGKVIQYRPYLVKEEKILLLALESKDEKQILNATREIISSCTFGKVNPDELPLFELEYIYLKLRTKSVGETVQLNLPCEKDGEEHLVNVNLDEVELIVPPESKNRVVQLTKNIGITLSYPTLGKISEIASDDNKAESTFKLIMACTESIYDAEKVYKRDSFNEKELRDFLESFNADQFKKLYDFFSNLPHLEKTIKFKCKKCGHENVIKVTGLQSFFV